MLKFLEKNSPAMRLLRSCRNRICHGGRAQAMLICPIKLGRRRRPEPPYAWRKCPIDVGDGLLATLRAAEGVDGAGDGEIVVGDLEVGFDALIGDGLAGLGEIDAHILDLD